MVVQRLGYTGDDRREVVRVHERNEQPDEPGASVLEAARAAVDRIAPLADDPRDALARLRRDVIAPVEDPGNRRHRDVRFCSNVVNRGTFPETFAHLSHRTHHSGYAPSGETTVARCVAVV